MTMLSYGLLIENSDSVNRRKSKIIDQINMIYYSHFRLKYQSYRFLFVSRLPVRSMSFWRCSASASWIATS